MYLRDCSAQTRVRAANTEKEVEAQTVYLPQSQYTNIGPTSSRADPIMPGAVAGWPLE